MTQGSPSSAPHARQQLAAVAELRWRIFANSLRTFRGRLELASRIFIGVAFVAGGIGGAFGLGGAAWFVVSQKNPEWLGGLLWPVFLFWQLFPLMATAFTQNVESSSLLRFPLSYRSYFLIRLVSGSLDPATAVASLWLLGIDIGIGVARPTLLPWATIERRPGKSHSRSHALRLAGTLAGPAAHARNHGHPFLPFCPELSACRSSDHSL
jgi:ABC-2 type transport system permease protein